MRFATTSLWLCALTACAASTRVDKPFSTPPVVTRTSCADTAGLDARRARAVTRGVDFMASYLETDERLAAIGSDGVEIFLEIALTAASSELRTRSLAIARRYAARLYPRYLAPNGLNDTWSRIDALELLVDSASLALPREELAAAIDARFATLHGDRERYGVDLADPEHLADGPAFDVLMAAYTFARAERAFPHRYAVDFTLERALDALWSRPLATFRSDGAEPQRAIESAYLATHIALVASEYGRRVLTRESIGRFEFYLRSELPAYLHARDVEITGEIADVLRQIGERDERSSALCDATRLLVAMQNPDGSWGAWQRASDPYSAVHPTWAAVTGLLERAAHAR